MYLKKQFERIKLIGLACEGCTLDEINKQEQIFNIKLPKVYKEFLTICGKEPEHLFCGCNVTLTTWNYINEGGRDSFKEALNQNCPESLFFIMEHHGYSYYYIDLNEGENPDVWLLVHGDEITNKPIGKISDVLNKEIDKLEHIKKPSFKSSTNDYKNKSLLNEQKLRDNLRNLKDEPINSAIIINSLGSKIYLVKEKNTFYCLLIPERPVNNYKTTLLLNLGFIEKFKGINFYKEFKQENIDQIVTSIISVFGVILGLDNLKEWRLELTNGIINLRIQGPLLTMFQLRQRNFKKYGTLSYKIKTLIFAELGFSIIISIGIFSYLTYKTSEISIINLLYSISIPVFSYCLKLLQKKYKRKK